MSEETSLRTALGAVIAAAGATPYGLVACPLVLDLAEAMMRDAPGQTRRQLAGGRKPPRRRRPIASLNIICRACAMCPRGQV